jgi:hypothetical protein
MAKHRTAFVLLSATASTMVAAADPAPTPQPIKPRTLATGAPACGNLVANMGYKSYGPPPACAPTPTQIKLVKSVLAAVDDTIREARETVAIFDLVSPDRSRSLTLSPEGRPRS